jgi:hypothetical protein
MAGISLAFTPLIPTPHGDEHSPSVHYMIENELELKQRGET